MEVTSEQLYLIASIALVYVLCRTGSLRKSISTSVITFALFVHSLLQAVHIDNTFFIIYTATAVLVWRVVPHEKKDTWGVYA